MNSRLKKATRLAWGVMSVAFISAVSSVSAFADTASNILRQESAGATIIMDAGAYNQASVDFLGIKIDEDVEIEEDDVSNLMMANVRSVLNVREEATTDSAVVGLLYKDCGGKVLERGEEWSKIQSGDLIGWASNEYLLFDEEAEELAKSVGTMTAIGTNDVIYVRAEPNTESEFYGFLAKNALVEVIDEVDDDWICIAYGDCDGYVQSEYVDIDFNVDAGETMEAINERKRAAEEYRKSLIGQREAIAADDDTEKLLAALIQCEAVGEPYEGKLAVGAVVMNRVRSAAYPDTVIDVIFASGQFSPVKSGSLSRVYNAGPRDDCYQAAREALDGYTNVGEMTHFRRKGNKEGFIIGNHVFY